MEIDIKKGSGIDNLVSGYCPGKVDKEKIISVDNHVGGLYKKYQTAVESHDFTKINQIVRFITLSDDVDDVFSPEEISGIFDTFQKLVNNGENDLGVFISKLLQNSYDAGYNNFSLSVSSKVFSLGSYIRGNEDRLLVLGVAGQDIPGGGGSTRYVSYRFQNESPIVGWGARDSQFVFYGSAKACGNKAKRCEFIFRGEVGRFVGMDALDCTFKAHSQGAIDVLTSCIPDIYHKGDHSFRTGNRIIFIHEDGEEEIVADYSVRGGRVRIKSGSR